MDRAQSTLNMIRRLPTAQKLFCIASHNKKDRNILENNLFQYCALDSIYKARLLHVLERYRRHIVARRIKFYHKCSLGRLGRNCSLCESLRITVVVDITLERGSLCVLEEYKSPCAQEYKSDK